MKGGVVAMKRLLSSLLIAMILLLPSSSHALLISDYTPAEYNRFYSGSDKNFIGQAYNFSGVGYSSDGRWATLVSNNYFISAYHYYPGQYTPGATVTFYATNNLAGSKYTYTVAGGQRIGMTDLWIGWFDTPVDPSIARYPVEMLPTYGDYQGQTLYNYGRDQTTFSTPVVGRNVMDSFYSESWDGSKTDVTYYGYNSATPSEAFLQGGDSGAPSFVAVNSSLALIGPHWLAYTYADNTPAGSADTFVPSYFNQVNNVMAAKGETLMAVPEPNLSCYIFISAFCLWLKHRRSDLLHYFEHNSKIETTEKDT
jgi:hypothetical protein